MCYDIANKESFDYVPKVLQEIDRYAAEDIVILLTGNKCDLEEHREVPVHVAQVSCIGFLTSCRFKVFVFCIFAAIQQIFTHHTDSFYCCFARFVLFFNDSNLPKR